MKRPLAATLALALGLLLVPLAASASTVRAFVQEFAVSSPGADDFRHTLKTLLASRLGGDGIDTVDSASEADVVVSGSYTVLGKMFSLDAVAKSASGKQLATAFEQGEAPDAVIPAVSKVAAKLKKEILQGYRAKAPAAPAQAERPAAAAAETPRQAHGAPWSSQRIAGAQSALAPAGPNLLATAKGPQIRLYRKDATLVPVAETELPARLKIIALDSSPGPDGRMLLFASVIDGDAAASRIYQVGADGMKLVKENVPYLFRSVAVNGGGSRLYAQQLGRDLDFYGDVYEAAFSQGEVALKNPLKMPRFANVFNFNIFRDRSGKSFLTAFSESGYLIVYSEKGEELWRSDDKLGGSETFFTLVDKENERFFGSASKPRFIDQRITVTERGEIIVPQNEGLFVFGNTRSYSKYAMVAFSWNGSSLEELWRTKQTQAYLADYFLIPASRELVLLEVTQKEGVFGKGASAVRVTTIQ